MGGVVAEHQQVQAAGLGPAGGEGALMAGESDQADRADLFGGFEGGQGAVRRGESVPLGLAFDVVQGDDVEPVGVEFVQGAIDLALHAFAVAGLELDGDDDLIAAVAQFGDRAAESVGLPAPVEVVDAPVDGVADIRGGELVVAAGGQAEAAYLGEIGVDLGGAVHGWWELCRVGIGAGSIVADGKPGEEPGSGTPAADDFCGIHSDSLVWRWVERRENAGELVRNYQKGINIYESQ